jgi:hypothetical protein
MAASERAKQVKEETKEVVRLTMAGVVGALTDSAAPWAGAARGHGVGARVLQCSVSLSIATQQ